MCQQGIIRGSEYRKAPGEIGVSRGLAPRTEVVMQNHSILSLITKEESDRFWTKVDKSGDCWEWKSLHHKSGHGKFKLRGRMLGAHRIAYHAIVGEIGAGIELHHTCHNPGCVNPAHLQPLTKSEHSRLNPMSIAQASQTHCKRGHAFTDENTYLWRGRRYCRECQRARDRRRGSRRVKSLRGR